MRSLARAGLCLVLVLPAACSGGAPEERAADELGSPLASPRTVVTSGPTGRPDALGGQIPRPGSTRTTPPRDTTGQAPAALSDDGPLGANAALYLRGSVPRLIVEIDAVRGYGASEDTLDLLRQRLMSVVDKPGGITFDRSDELPSHGGDWTIQQLEAAERRYRDTKSTASAASMYLLFVDGAPPQKGAIGVSYSASSAAIFEEQIEDASTLLVGSSAIERAVVVHEVGHLLSLVNIGFESARDHEDAEHEGHSDNEDSVMFWAVDNVGVAALLGGRTQPPTDFDADDRADLADIRSGRRP